MVRTIAICWLVVFGLFTGLGAGEPAKRPAGPPPGPGKEMPPEDLPPVDLEEAEALDLIEEEFPEEFEEEEEVVFLGRTFKLRFQLVPEEGDEEPQWVLVATRRFAYEISFGNNDEEFRFEVGGQVFLLEDKKAILVTFEASLSFEGAEGRGTIAATGSTVLPLGQARTVARLGEKSLTVTAEAADKEGGKKLAPMPEAERKDLF